MCPIKPNGTTPTEIKRVCRRKYRPSGENWRNNSEAAENIGCHPDTLNKLRSSGQGPRYIKRLGKVWYRVDWLEEWLLQGQRTSTSQGQPHYRALRTYPQGRP
jgi:hypothetical protein